MKSPVKTILAIGFAILGLVALIGAIRFVPVPGAPEVAAPKAVTTPLPLPPSMAGYAPSSPPPPPVVETPAAPRVIEPSKETTPRMDVAVGRGTFITHQAVGSYPVFTHALCSDGVVHPIRFERIIPLKNEFDIQYAVADGATVQDFCIVFLRYDPTRIKLVKGPELDTSCTLPTEGFNTCARTDWALCEGALKGDKRFCQTVSLLPDLEARIYSTTDNKTCDYRALFVYQGRELPWHEEKGTFQKQCIWSGGDGEFGDDQRFRDNKPSRYEGNMPMIFTIQDVLHVAQFRAGMEGENWFIYALRGDKLETVQHTYFYSYY